QRVTAGGPGRSLPLDGARGLGGDVEGDAVDLADLVGDAAGDPREHVEGHLGPVRGHRVVAGDGAQHDRVAVGAAVALDTHGAHVGQQHDGALPDGAIEYRGGEVGAGDRIGRAEDVHALLRDVADDADAEAGAGEGLAPVDVVGQAQFGA